MSEWIRVKDRLPELTEKNHWDPPELNVYFVRNGKVIQGVCNWSDYAGVVFMSSTGIGFLPEEVSHWMPNPMPKPPAIDEKG